MYQFGIINFVVGCQDFVRRSSNTSS